MDPIVITGLGVISPLGCGVDQNWSAIRDGHSGIAIIDQPWADQSPVQIGGQVGEDLSQWLDRVALRRLDRVSQLAMIAADQAWRDADLSDAAPHYDRLAVSVGTGIGGLQTILDQHEVLGQRGPARMSPFTVTGLMSNAPAAHIALRIGAQAAVHAPVSACASGAEAIALGADQIRLGRADVALVGGTEATLTQFGIGAFASMHALSRRNDTPAAASRPWDRGRDGFVMSEGAAMLVLERLSSAHARGAKIHGTLAGYGISADGHDMVHPDPAGLGQQAAMSKALRDADLAAGDISHVNAHATSTIEGDLIEAAAIAAVLGSDRGDLIVTSTKSTTGHLLGAAGALEAIATLAALRKRTAPPTINLDDPEELPIQIAANQAIPLPTGQLAALTNSFGFGGHNVCLALTNQHAN